MPESSRRWPAEWERHRATWLSWPHNIETWPGRLEAVEDAFCEIVRAISPGEAVEIHVLDRAMAERVRARLRGAGVEDADRVNFHLVATDDAWIRDHGGVFVIEGEGENAVVELIDFEFDAWGGKYPPWDRDAKVAAEMARIADTPRIDVDHVLEPDEGDVNHAALAENRKRLASMSDAAGRSLEIVELPTRVSSSVPTAGCPRAMRISISPIRPYSSPSSASMPTGRRW